MGGEDMVKMTMKRRRKNTRHSPMEWSFSASLPDDVRGAYVDSICAVKCSYDPFADFRESIVEMILDLGVRDWEEMEELVYCYVVLNPSDVHGFIADAFLSVCSPPGVVAPNGKAQS